MGVSSISSITGGRKTSCSSSNSRICATRRKIEAVKKHLEQTAREKLGTSPPIFAVSAKIAFQAKTGDPAQREQLLAQSHFDELERHIGESIASGESGGGKLRSVCQSAQVIVRELAEKAKGRSPPSRRTTTESQQLGGVLEERKEQSLRQVGGVLWSLAQNFERTQQKSEELLTERLSWAPDVAARCSGNRSGTRNSRRASTSNSATR